MNPSREEVEQVASLHSGTWHNAYGQCGAKCLAKLALMGEVGRCHWGCCYSTNHYSLCSSKATKKSKARTQKLRGDIKEKFVVRVLANDSQTFHKVRAELEKFDRTGEMEIINASQTTTTRPGTGGVSAVNLLVYAKDCTKVEMGKDLKYVNPAFIKEYTEYVSTPPFEKKPAMFIVILQEDEGINVSTSNYDNLIEEVKEKIFFVTSCSSAGHSDDETDGKPEDHVQEIVQPQSLSFYMLNYSSIHTERKLSKEKERMKAEIDLLMASFAISLSSSTTTSFKSASKNNSNDNNQPSSSSNSNGKLDDLPSIVLFNQPRIDPLFATLNIFKRPKLPLSSSSSSLTSTNSSSLSSSTSGSTASIEEAQQILEGHTCTTSLEVLLTCYPSRTIVTTMRYYVASCILLISAKYDQLNLMRFILRDECIQLNSIESKTGKTCLHYAVINNNISMVCLLLEHGADWTIADRNGNPPNTVRVVSGVSTLSKEMNDVFDHYLPRFIQQTLHLLSQEGVNAATLKKEKEKLLRVINVSANRKTLIDLLWKEAKIGNVQFHTDIPQRQLTINRIIGHGAFGKVYSGKYMGENVAIKFIDENTPNFDLDAFRTERAALSLLRHPNIIRLIGSGRWTDASTNGPKSSGFHLVFPLMKKTLSEMIYAEGHPPLNVYKIALQIAQAMLYLHDHKIIHRDLKPDNILVSYEDDLVVADLGIARADFGTMNKTVIGTQKYMAPELFNGKMESAYSFSVDVWSYGVTLWEVLSRQSPSVMIGPQPLRISNKWKVEYQTLIEDCLNVGDPKKRPTFEYIVNFLINHRASLSSSVELHDSRRGQLEEEDSFLMQYSPLITCLLEVSNMENVEIELRSLKEKDRVEVKRKLSQMLSFLSEQHN